MDDLVPHLDNQLADGPGFFSCVEEKGAVATADPWRSCRCVDPGYGTNSLRCHTYPEGDQVSGPGFDHRRLFAVPYVFAVARGGT